MEQKKIVLFILIVHLVAFLAGCSGNKNSGNNDSSDLWNKLSSYFRPPAEYENVYGNFRSPSLYYNGDTVRTVEDWQRRRTEIKDRYSDGTDWWTALNHTIAVNRLLGYRNKVAMSNRVNHDPTPESNEIVYDFFEWYLYSANKSPKE